MESTPALIMPVRWHMSRRFARLGGAGVDQPRAVLGTRHPLATGQVYMQPNEAKCLVPIPGLLCTGALFGPQIEDFRRPHAVIVVDP